MASIVEPNTRSQYVVVVVVAVVIVVVVVVVAATVAAAACTQESTLFCVRYVRVRCAIATYLLYGTSEEVYQAP